MFTCIYATHLHFVVIIYVFIKCVWNSMGMKAITNIRVYIAIVFIPVFSTVISSDV